ncbi:50S ribosomal protein L4 [Tropheryma whipplei]|uniref:50S ribosomal protein L4 n=1 Tax=Tropheryma whipplei TaxID=2039 RepID=UPI0004B65DE6|nr:50S ribosomal protein L4 [Tropheryma whipplei]MCO8182580.1 50S ribosomal protein L4 [Tropheryma whipplei]
MSPSATVFDIGGNAVGTLQLVGHLFDSDPNLHLIHQVVVAQQAAFRQGTHKTKSRAEVSGSGRKPFRQKGTGNARCGSTRAPQMRGGGVVHGPVPRSYVHRTPKKMIKAALAGCLTNRARAGRVHIVDSFGDTPSVADALTLFQITGLSSKLLVVAQASDSVAYRSVRNIPGVRLVHVGQLNSYDVLRSDDVLFTRGAYNVFVGPSGDLAFSEDRDNPGTSLPKSPTPEDSSDATKARSSRHDDRSGA